MPAAIRAQMADRRAALIAAHPRSGLSRTSTSTPRLCLPTFALPLAAGYRRALPDAGIDCFQGIAHHEWTSGVPICLAFGAAGYRVGLLGMQRPTAGRPGRERTARGNQ